VAAAQSSRDDWKPGSYFDVGAHLTHSLADAPLTSKEREQIYRLIDNQDVHDAFTDAQRDEERKIVMSARVGSIVLADDGSRQVLVQGPTLFCGAHGNCSYWIFIRHRGQLRLVLDAAGSFIVRNTSSHGFRDVATGLRMSAYEGVFTVYRWNGAKYEEADCYSVKLDRDYPDKPPVIAGCTERDRH
jgi:hypothetical protein